MPIATSLPHTFEKYFWLFQIFLSVISGINMLRGFLIFVIFIWKPSVWRKIVKRHPKLVKFLTLPTRYFSKSGAQQEVTEEQIPLEQIHLIDVDRVETGELNRAELT